ncbi:MAG: element excision factor XisI family protein [Spirulinaceae cyanobacterium]
MKALANDMERLEQYRVTLEKVLHEHAQLSQQVRAEHPNDPENPAEAIAVCDPKTDNYLLITAGWTPSQRIHSILAHFRIIDEQIYIEWSGIEDLIEDLIDQGIPKSAFLPAQPQHFTSSPAI